MSQSYVFPPPPPTRNTLTLQQKSQLRRSTNKLTKVLGAPPHLVDDYSRPIRIDLSVSLAHSHGAAKPKTHARRKTLGEIYDPESYPLSSAAPPALPLSRTYSRSSSSSSSSRPSIDSGYHSPPPPLPSSRSASPQSRRPPIFVEAIRPCPTPRNVPLSRSLLSPSAYSSRSSSPLYRSPSCASEIEVSDAIHPHPPHSKGQVSPCPPAPFRDSITDSILDTPSFEIQTPLQARRAKMARVTKLLGEGVPVELVFRDDPTDYDDGADDEDLDIKWREETEVEDEDVASVRGDGEVQDLRLGPTIYVHETTRTPFSARFRRRF